MLKQKTVYQLDDNGIYIGETVADESPLEPGVFLIPAGCVMDPPPVHVEGRRRVHDGAAWTYVDEPEAEQEPTEPPKSLAELKAEKNEEINRARLVANQSTFPHAGKTVECDQLSRSDIDGVANHIALFGSFPPDFPGFWKAYDNSLIPMPSIDDFKAMYQSMTAQGTANFNHAQALKAQLYDPSTDTPEKIAAITW